MFAKMCVNLRINEFFKQYYAKSKTYNQMKFIKLILYLFSYYTKKKVIVRSG